MLDFQYCWRSTQRNSDIREYALEDICRRQMRLSLEYRPSEAWKLLSRVAFTSFYCDDHSSEEGMMLMQEVEWHTSLCSQPLSLAVRLSFFDVSDYDARIYSYESDMVYEFSVPMMTGRGMRCYLVCRHNFSEQLSAAFKYAVAYYPENEEIGSGYDLIIGNVKHECKFQMGLRF